MGIPGFFQQIEKNHPEFIHPNPPYPIDILTWDFNAILYNCFHQTTKFHNPQNYNLFSNALLQNIAINLERIINNYTPKKVLYIAMDGVVPQQKMAEQRARRAARYLTRSWWSFLQIEAPVSKKPRLPYIPDKNPNQTTEKEFTTMEFTPGSSFYVQLHQFLLKELSKYKKIIPEIIYDSPFTPGEAEQKILEWISKQIPVNNIQTNIYLISKDADLLVLPYALRPRNIYILREMEERFEEHLSKVWGMNRSSLPEFMVIDLPKMYSYYIQTVRQQLRDIQLDDTAMFRDQEALTFFVGNDFIKPIFFLPSTWRDSQNYIQSAYRYSLDITGGTHSLIERNPIRNRWTFNLRVLVGLFSYLANHEVSWMNQYIKMILQKGKQKPRDNKTPTFDEWITHLDFTNIEHPWSPIMIPLYENLEKITNIKRNRFMENELEQIHLRIHPFEPIVPSAKDYLGTLQYNLEYYMTHRPPSWRNSYEPPISPFPSQILRWLMSNVNQKEYLDDVIEIERDENAYRPLLNFISVLPDVPQFQATDWIPKMMAKPWTKWWNQRNWSNSLIPTSVLEPPCDVGTASKWEHKTLLLHLPQWDIKRREKMLNEIKLNAEEQKRDEVLSVIRI